MKKIISLLLCVVLAVSMMAVLSGCGGAKEDITGKWEAEVNMAEAINQSVAGADASMAEIINFKDFTLKIELELNKDGTYKMYCDEASATKAFANLKVDFKDMMIDYLEKTISDAGLEMSIDDMLALTGLNLDQLIEESFTDAILDEMISEMYSEGQYKAENGKFYTSDDIDEAPASTAAESYTLEGNKLTLNGLTGTEDELYGLIYPLEFKRVG